MKLFYAIVMSALCLSGLCSASAYAQAWDGTSEKWTQGDGSENNPYLIDNARQLAYLSDQVNGGETFKGKFFKLTTNLDMGKADGKVFPKIGNFDEYLDPSTMLQVDNSAYFLGTFDGDFHTIDGLAINYVNEELGGTGLFACANAGTVIRNLIIGENSTIQGGYCTGSFIGFMNGGLLENCQNKAVLTTLEYSGGIVGSMEGGVVKGCVNSGAITGTTEIGGIVGQGAEMGSVMYCYNTAAVTATGFGGGGIGGALYGTTFFISNCYSIGAITGGSSPYLGSPHAIVSDAGTASVTNCYYVKELATVDDSKATAKTEAEMKDAAIIGLLNAGQSLFKADTKNLNNSFPILAWQENVSAGINDVVNDSTVDDIVIDGREVSAANGMEVYDMAGRLVNFGDNVSLDNGAYIVKSGRSVKKVLIH